MKRLLCFLLLVAVTAGCGSDKRSILYAGIQPGIARHRIKIPDSEARAAAQRAIAEWRAGLAANARRFRHLRFANLPESVFRARLHASALRYGFKVEAVRFYHPRQLAPYVVVETDHYLRLSHALPAIERRLDPHSGKSDFFGWAYEGFYFQGNDERGIPFVVVSNLARGHVEGSQFARSEELYPFAHG